ncbi:hypothetical protein J2129_002124 [Methanofollis sp. W23]|uniref:hypothetical protein n=1 Tax=Methanofollis sp. W23 TaxID=2817849 RepID=UPI001AE6D825|nr:hypothetical protein [Methanofollis sp. W23]MBP2146670.1 hypothetical protein [Methanofollis sp. W23]
MKISAAILVAFMLLMLPAAASGLVEGGENISYDDGGGNDAPVLSAEGDVAPADVRITANREHLVRNNDFCVTVRGESRKQYYLFIEDAGVSDAGYPLIKEGQPSVEIIGDAPFPDAPAAAIANEKRAGDGAHFPDQTAALVQTDVSGVRTLGLSTYSATTPRSFTIMVIDPEDETRVDTVGVTVEEGEVTIAAEGAGTYSLGEEIALSGTNTASDTTYLFLTGTDLGCGVPLDSPSLNA